MTRWLDELPRPTILPAAWWRRHVRHSRQLVRIGSPTPSLSGASSGRTFVDISALARTDAGTGIQRLVKVELERLILNQSGSAPVLPVAATRMRPYAAIAWPLVKGNATADPISPTTGDRFFGLDLSAHIIPQKLNEMMAWRQQGVHFSFVVYDMLPLLHPEWFSGKLVAAFRRWIRAVAILADEVLCISPDVERHFHHWMDSHYGLTCHDIPSRLLPISVECWSSRLWSAEPADRSPQLVSADRYCLAVGTVEPRKGYGDLLDAFDRLWQAGEETALVIAGRPGWKTSRLQARLRHHAEWGRRLFWFDNADDQMLGQLYAHCAGVIQSSLGEGLGLPLLEAVSAGKPVFARDLPVYRDIGFEAEAAHFFPEAARGVELAPYLSDFLAILVADREYLAREASRDAG